MSSLIEGELQSLGTDGFEGWAWDSSKPYDPVEVEILCNETVIASAQADRFSLDLVKQRKGNGMHAFSALPSTLPKTQYPIKIWARVRGHEIALSGAITIDSPSELAEVFPKSLLQDFEGYVDGIRDGFLIGWVRNAALPEEPVEVELRDGDQLILRASANHFRADVEQQIPGGGDSGFELELPYTLLDGQLHNLSVKVAGTSFELGNSPISFGPGAYNILVKELLRLREVVNTWETRTEAYTRQLMARFEALHNIQRDSFEREIQAIKTVALGLPRLAEPPAPTKIETQDPPSEPQPDAQPTVETSSDQQGIKQPSSTSAEAITEDQPPETDEPISEIDPKSKTSRRKRG